MSLHKCVCPNIPVFREKSARFVAAKVSAVPEARVSFSRKRDIRRMWSPMAYCVVLSFNRLVCSTSIQRCTRSSIKETPANKCHPGALKLITIYAKSICIDTCIYTRIKMCSGNFVLVVRTTSTKSTSNYLTSCYERAAGPFRYKIDIGTFEIHPCPPRSLPLQRGLKTSATERYKGLDEFKVIPTAYSSQAIDGNLCQASAYMCYIWSSRHIQKLSLHRCNLN